MEKVKLYIGGCMSDLNKKASYSFDSGRSTRIHINHAEKTFQAAEEARLKGDEERGYILYMRYLDIFQKVRQSRDYKKDESHFSLLLGTSKFADAIAKAEQLSKSLKIRYEEKESGGKIAEDSTKTNGATSVKSAANSAQGISEQKPEPAKEVSKNGVDFIPKDAKSIGSQKLYELLFGNRLTGAKVLMMDIRSPEEFKESCIRHPDCINVPKTHINPGTTSRKIEAGIQNIDHVDEWKNRALADVIVMIDWHANEKRLNDVKDPLRSLKDALWKWDQEIFLKREPVVLTGGYVDWLDYFPQFTTNPKVQRPSSKPKNVTSISSLIDFNFHDLITPESKATPENGIPTSDEGKKEDSDDWDSAEYIEAKTAVKSLSSTLQPSPKSPSAAPEGSVGLYPTVPNDISLGGVNEKKPDQKHVAGKNVSFSSEVTKKNEKNVPSVDRSTKPVMPSRALKPQTEIEKPAVAEMKAPSIKESQQWPPAAFTDVTEVPSEPAKKSQEQPSEDPQVVAMRERIAKMKKMKEESEQKTKEIEEKKKLAELQAMEKRMLEEMEEQERQRKQAEKELAERMRELAKPIKPNTEKEADSAKEKGAPSTAVDKTSSPAKPPDTTTLKLEEKVNVPSVPRDKKPLEEDKKAATPSAAVKDKKDQPPNEPIYASVSKPKTASSTNSRPPVKTSDEVDGTKSTEEVKSEDAVPAVKQATKPSSATDRPSIKKDETPTPKKEVLKPSPPKPVAASKQVEPAKAPETAKMPAQDNKPQAPGRSVPSDPYASKKLIKTNDVKPSTEKSQPKPVQAKNMGDIPGSSASISRKGSANLPINWEKRLDSKTGRYFFLDHNTQTTHWTLPSNVVANNQIKKAPLKDESASGGGSLKRSRSTPNIAELIEEETKNSQRPKPVVPNRNFKPSTVPEAVPDPPDVYTERLLRLHPVGGGPGPGLCGLQNLGNTCYMNSVLQCMFNTTLLTEYFLKNLYKRDINRENFLGSGGEITDGFATVLKAVWEGKYRHLTPRDFRHTIAKFNPRFGGYIQQDSQELLLFLMDGLHEDLNRITKRKYVEEEDNDRLDDATAADIAWRYHKRLNESIIVELFQGQFKATVQCLHCRKTSRKFDVFMYLSLPLTSHNSSIHECIQNFSKEEKLSGDNKWRCPACKCERDAVRKMEIWKLPPVLLIHFKRFSFSGRWRDKIQSSVSFPEEGLNMNKYAKGRNTRKAYNLYSVSHHHGASLDSGHYVASCKSPLDGNWYKYDDHEVSRTSVPQGPSAYILCYTSIEHSICPVNTK